MCEHADRLDEPMRSSERGATNGSATYPRMTRGALMVWRPRTSACSRWWSSHLDTDDDANVIFETLNARGTPLLASNTRKELGVQPANWARRDLFYARRWRDFDEPWWREEVRQGRVGQYPGSMCS